VDEPRLLWAIPQQGGCNPRSVGILYSRVGDWLSQSWQSNRSCFEETESLAVVTKVRQPVPPLSDERLARLYELMAPDTEVGCIIAELISRRETGRAPIGFPSEVGCIITELISLRAAAAKDAKQSPWAWAFRPIRKSDFDYLVFTNQEDAEREAFDEVIGEDEIEPEVIPLYPRPAREDGIDLENKS
jgi:hypothetical protein